MARKIYVALLFLIPQVLWAQLRYDSLLSRYTYQCNCSESLIIQGTPTATNYHSKQKSVTLFQVKVDTVFYTRALGADELNTAFILSNSIETSKTISESNLFVLKQCFYCQTPNQLNCRPLLYYELVAAAKTESMTLDVVRRQHMITPCADCQSMRPIPRRSFTLFQRKHKEWDISELDTIEKYIERERRKR